MREFLTAGALALVFFATFTASSAEAGFSCDEARKVCFCAGSRESAGCKRMAEKCSKAMICGEKGCSCAYWRGFLGGPMRRN